jgi:hypothetical protein
MSLMPRPAQDAQAMTFDIKCDGYGRREL